VEYWIGLDWIGLAVYSVYWRMIHMIHYEYSILLRSLLI